MSDLKLSDEWKQKAKQWIEYVTDKSKYVDRPDIETREGVKLILEALLQQ